MDEQICSNSIAEGYQEDIFVYLVYQQGFLVKTTYESLKTLVFSLLYVKLVGRGVLMSLASDKVVDEQLT